MASYKSMYIDLFVTMKRAAHILKNAELLTGETDGLSEDELVMFISENNKFFDSISDETRLPLKIDKVLIGKNIRNMRNNHSITIEELSRELDISAAYLGLIERGDRNVTLNKLCQLSNFFGVNLEHFLRPQIDSKKIG
ncbi:MAG: helix-turn-helix domain-containing protein [Defluviitaleaceae bacterium]|nr:helix-turn-helix domain-containing protein [Defluviitaleaceae bacterium]